jgi:hypothetical protein
MAVRVEVSGGIARVRISGRVIGEDFRNAFTAMVDHPDFQHGMNALWDTRTANFSQFDSEDLLRFAEFVGRYATARDGARGALVVPAEEDHGLSAMYEKLAEIKLPIQTKVFRDLAEAEAWLASPGGSD